MSTGTGRQQNRLLPYLLAILVVLLAYTVYTRVLRPARPPAAVVATPPPVAATPAQPGPTPAAAPSPAASPATGSPGPGPAVVPARPSGRSNPFAALVTEQAARPTPPPAPPVPPPFFPGRPGEGPGAGGTKLAGVLMKDGEALAIVQMGQVTYIVSEGDVVEQFRVARIEPERVVLRSGTQELSLELGGEQSERGPQR
ncbi:MAG: hypothetical protein QN213_10055 [Armatimonadota bacterium]|nr:hypothetical protein [Armatimonadota bacterium]MDR7599182.1 hypothetical protein [Armatimonadota bacterium]MDR7606451.1 hypothetical protein [Armatimonadota bacterium]